MNKMAARIFVAIFKANKGRTKNLGIYLQNPINKNYSCEYNFSLEKVGLFVHHVESLHVGLPLVVRVPQFGNHCIKRTAG